jgi:tetrahydromethanopterin S-methyltransferase subunit D
MMWIFLLPTAILGILGYSDLKQGTVPTWGLIIFMLASVITVVFTVGSLIGIIGASLFTLLIIISGLCLVIMLFNRYHAADDITFVAAFCAYSPFFFVNAVFLSMINAAMSIFHEKEFPALWRFFIASLFSSLILAIAF